MSKPMNDEVFRLLLINQNELSEVQNNMSAQLKVVASEFLKIEEANALQQKEIDKIEEANALQQKEIDKYRNFALMALDGMKFFKKNLANGKLGDRYGNGPSARQAELVLNDPVAKELSMDVSVESEFQHQNRHRFLHGHLDELSADFINHMGKLPSQTTMMELMNWSYEQTRKPTVKEN